MLLVATGAVTNQPCTSTTKLTIFQAFKLLESLTAQENVVMFLDAQSIILARTANKSSKNS